MISDADIRDGYRWFLGRVPSEDEIRMNRRLYEPSGADALQNFQQGLVMSGEFRVRRLHLHKLSRTCPTELSQTRLVFMHIEKCGGTTLHAMLAAQFPAEQICPERHDTLGDWTINELANYRLFSGHFDVSCCRSIPGVLKLVTMLREPKARLLSLYYFWKSHRPHPERDLYNLLRLARACSVEEFFSHPTVVGHMSIRNAITGQLTRTSNSMTVSHDLIMSDPGAALERGWAQLQSFTAFGIVECFEASRLLLNRTLDMDMKPIAPQQVLEDLVRTHDDLDHVEREPMSERLDALLDPLTDIDCRLYARATALFRQRVASMTSAPKRGRPSLFRQLAAVVHRQ